MRVVALGSIGAFATLLWLGRGLTFFADEWAVMAERPISLDSFLQPFNEHWLGRHELVYRLLLGAVGLSSATCRTWRCWPSSTWSSSSRSTSSRGGGRSAGSAPSIALDRRVLRERLREPVLGDQIGFVGAIALGLGALLLLDGRPGRGRVIAVATALLTVGMMTSGFGIFMLVLVGLDLLLDPRRRRLVLALASRPASISPGTSPSAAPAWPPRGTRSRSTPS